MFSRDRLPISLKLSATPTHGRNFVGQSFRSPEHNVGRTTDSSMSGGLAN